MARILFLTEQLPYPLLSGSRIRNYYVLRHLAAHHQVTLLSFVRADDRPEYVTHLETFLSGVHTVPMQRSLLRNVRAVLVGLATGSPAIVARERIKAMQVQVRRFLASDQFDVIHVDQISMAQYGLPGCGARVKRLLDQHDIMSQVLERLADCEPIPWKRPLLRREARAFARYEAQVCRRFDRVVCVTERDQQALLSRGLGDCAELKGRMPVIPICIDPSAVEPVASVPVPFRVTHVGTMYWPPAVEGVLWFAQAVWPLVMSQVPSARLTLIGKNPPEAIQALARRPGVQVLGYVEDLTPCLVETAAFIVPLHAAGGMRVKILDAWCWGLPIASTTIGAEGISVQNGHNILIADGPAEFAQAVIRLLCEPELRQRLRTAGRRWVGAHYDWRRNYAAWDEVYAGLVHE